MTPKRIQRKRGKGWRMPDGVVYVGRPTRWGNPFSRMDFIPLSLGLELYSDMASGFWSPTKVNHLADAPLSHVYAAHHAWRSRIGGHPLEAIRSHLNRTDLACWCPLDQPCHADVLLHLANGGAG